MDELEKARKELSEITKEMSLTGHDQWPTELKESYLTVYNKLRDLERDLRKANGDEIVIR